MRQSCPLTGNETFCSNVRRACGFLLRKQSGSIAAHLDSSAEERGFHSEGGADSPRGRDQWPCTAKPQAQPRIGPLKPAGRRGGKAAASFLFINNTRVSSYWASLTSAAEWAPCPLSALVMGSTVCPGRALCPPTSLALMQMWGWRAGRANPSGPAEQSRTPHRHCPSVTRPAAVLLCSVSHPAAGSLPWSSCDGHWWRRHRFHFPLESWAAVEPSTEFCPLQTVLSEERMSSFPRVEKLKPTFASDVSTSLGLYFRFK